MAVLVEGMNVFPVRVGPRTSWLLVRLVSDAGVSGLGEASLGGARELPELQRFFRLLAQSTASLDTAGAVAEFRRAGWPLARRGGRAAVAFCALEMALWDLRGKLLGAPVFELLGDGERGGISRRSHVEVYANVNRMTRQRAPAAFARSAALAAEAGFRAVKAAPFDGFPPAGAAKRAVQAATRRGVEAMFAVREAVGDGVAVKVDCHTHFDRARAVRVAQRLAPAALDWYEEPLPIADLDGTRAVREAVPQRVAGGESLFGLGAFEALFESGAVDVAMPDVARCGGVAEMLRVVREAAARGVAVSPHNAFGPVATAASLAVCAVADVESLELQWGEVPWRGDLVEPPETVADGRLRVNDGPGFGIELSPLAARKARLG